MQEQMNCRAEHSRIGVYLDRELREPELSKFEAHLENCPACRNALVNERNFRNEVKSASPVTAAPVGLRARVERILGLALALIFTILAYFRRPF